MLNIALDISSFEYSRPTGISNYISEYLNQCSENINDFYKIHLLYKLSCYKKRLRMNTNEKFIFQAYYKTFSTMIEKPKIVHGLDCEIPNIRKTKKVVTVHDTFIHNERTIDVCSEQFKKKHFEKINFSVKSSDCVIAVSNTTKNDLLNHFPFLKNKIFTVPLGVKDIYKPANKFEINRIKEKYQLFDQYLLYVGEISSRKNTKRLVEAFKNSKLYKEFQLILVGKKSFNGNETIDYIKDLNACQYIKWINYVPENELPIFYTGAAGFTFPTLYEGFGMPILEALSCETPVLVGNRGESQFTAGGMCLTCDPYDTESISNGINQIVDSGVKINIEHIKKFTWHECFKKTLNIYSQII